MPKITVDFNQQAFVRDDNTLSFDKQEIKKFNMKFNTLDLRIIETIAKQKGVSRSQLINDFIENILKEFILNSSHDESLLLTTFAEQRLKNQSKKDPKDFHWDYWFISTQNPHPDTLLYMAKDSFHERMKDGFISPETINLLSLLQKEGFTNL